MFEPKLRNKPNITSTYKLINFMKGTALTVMRVQLFSERKNIERNIKNDAFLKKQLELIKETAEQLESQPIRSLTFGDFMTFYVTGSRKEYEYEYFLHRKRLNAFAVLAAVYEDNGKYIEALQNAIWAVTDEFTWALPAHIPSGTDIDDCKKMIDLFAAETAFTLAEISDILGDRLDPVIIKRINYEVRKRVIEPYLSGKENTWDALENNWAAVCAGSVGGAFLYLADEDEIKSVMPRLLETMSCYLNGFGEDGACVEGINYWIYGFGYFVYFAWLLFQYSLTDLFDNGKIEKIALFQQRVMLKNNKTVSFSDCSDKFLHRSGLSHFLAERFEGVIVPDDENAVGFNDDACYRFAHLIRDFAWRNPCVTAGEVQNGYVYFKDAAWYVKKTDTYDFAAKAGTNGESHNHNDIGGFLINAYGESIITDPGRGEYTAEYFGEGRYDYFAPSAHAHSVPIIGGKVQRGGGEYFGRITHASDEELVIDFNHAYDDKNISELTRRFEFGGDTIKMTDTICFAEKPESITEHFVAAIEPVQCNGGLIIGGVHMMYDTESVKFTSEKISFTDGHNQSKTVYTIDLELCGEKTSFEAVFKDIEVTRTTAGAENPEIL